MRDALHNEIDVAEQHIADARDAVRKIWETELPAIFELVKEDLDGDPQAGIKKALTVVAARVGQEIDPITTRAVRKGIALGRLRREVGGLGSGSGEGLSAPKLGRPEDDPRKGEL